MIDIIHSSIKRVLVCIHVTPITGYTCRKQTLFIGLKPKPDTMGQLKYTPPNALLY